MKLLYILSSALAISTASAFSIRGAANYIRDAVTETKQPETKQPETKQPETKQPETEQPEEQTSSGSDGEVSLEKIETDAINLFKEVFELIFKHSVKATESQSKDEPKINPGRRSFNIKRQPKKLIAKRRH
ncbi:hypothetical protein K502DRAFT_343724 [Neoconidiobolus thromboides FSU 785]|nr:hypothetical protein K502DRAFT_343724 [Neoconidiobolus thromboides FSU 785]